LPSLRLIGVLALCATAGVAGSPRALAAPAPKPAVSDKAPSDKAAEAERAGVDKVPADDTARSHHDQGRAASSFGRYETAISEYRRAYELKADPSYLYDIAEAYRALGVPERAVFFYRRYLSAHPHPPNRPEVERLIAVLEPPPPAALPITLTTVPIESNDPLGLGSEAHVVSDQERSAIGRWWFWTAVGALAAAGATVAILAATRDDRRSTGSPNTDLGNARFDF
jgi:tetratricopeptide (TPR) repeat protein